MAILGVATRACQPEVPKVYFILLPIAPRTKRNESMVKIPDKNIEPFLNNSPQGVENQLFWRKKTTEKWYISNVYAPVTSQIDNDNDGKGKGVWRLRRERRPKLLTWFYHNMFSSNYGGKFQNSKST